LLILASADPPLDFHSRACSTDQLLASNGIDDHHIPSLQVPRWTVADSRHRDCVPQPLLYIDSATNQRISLQCPFHLHGKNWRDEPGFPMRAVLQQPFGFPMDRKSKGCERRLQSVPASSG